MYILPIMALLSIHITCSHHFACTAIIANGILHSLVSSPSNIIVTVATWQTAQMLCIHQQISIVFTFQHYFQLSN